MSSAQERRNILWRYRWQDSTYYANIITLNPYIMQRIINNWNILFNEMGFLVKASKNFENFIQ